MAPMRPNAREENKPERIAEGWNEHHDRKAEDAGEKDRAAPETVGNGSDRGGGKELHQSVAHHDGAVPGRLSIG